MVLGNVKCLEVVVRSFHLRPGDDCVAERKENALDLLERLAQRMLRAERARYAWQRKIVALACERRLVGGGFNLQTPGFERCLDMRFDLVERLADRAF